MNAETAIQNRIRIALAALGVRLFRNPVGMAYFSNGSPVHFGLCVGSSDLIGYTATGRFIAIEVKTPTGRATDEQLAFIEAVRKVGGIAFIAHSVEEAIALVRRA